MSPIPTYCSLLAALAALAGSAPASADIPRVPAATGSETAAAPATAVTARQIDGAAPGSALEARPAPPARRSAESVADRRALLRRHALEHAVERLERQASEAVYRYVPTPRPRHLQRSSR